MRHLLILACLLFGTGAMADEADFDFKSLGAKKALRDYKATLAKEDKAKQKAMKEMEAEAKKAQKTNRVELIMNLEQALKKALQDADLEEANKIDAAIKALKKGASPAGASVVGSKGKKKAKKSKARIPRNAVKWNGHHYLLSDIIMSHPEAKKRCERAGGHLVRIENVREQEFVARLASKSGRGHYWIDGSDEIREGRWLFSDDKPIQTFFWAWDGKPSDPSGNEDHLELRQGAGWKWNDKRSGAANGFICEWDE